MPATTNGHIEDESITHGLLPYSTCDVSDALLRLGHPHSGFIAGPTLWSPERQTGRTRIVGPAYTVQYAKPQEQAEPFLLGHYIDAVPAGAVIVISAPHDVPNAVFGSLMSTRAKYRGAVGTVVDGNIRDVEEHRSMQYPIFARGVATASPYGAVRVSKINTAVEVGTGSQRVIVRPGDYIVADANGVVCVPHEFLHDLVGTMQNIFETDSRIAEDMRGGMTFVDASHRHRAKAH